MCVCSTGLGALNNGFDLRVNQFEGLDSVHQIKTYYPSVLFGSINFIALAEKTRAIGRCRAAEQRINYSNGSLMKSIGNYALSCRSGKNNVISFRVTRARLEIAGDLERRMPASS